MTFTQLDFIILCGYFLIILGAGLFASKDKKGHEKNAEDYFLASKSLPWWAVGASLIAANISAEQFVGMSGSGFAIGLAIASYEWMAALTILIVGKFFLPIFIEKGLYTIPEFIEKRYTSQLKTILAVFWMALYIFVNLSSVLYLGSLAMSTILGVPIMYGVIGLALFAVTYSLYGGLSAVAWTDVIQVVFLILGGLVTTYLALDAVSGGGGIFDGFNKVLDAAPEKFHMIIDSSDAQYMNLPGIWVLIGGLWVANLYYWGFNQYIIQRTLAAKSLKEAQNGIALAAFLKIIIPFIVVLPGIACHVIINDPEILASLGPDALFNMPTATKADQAYPWLLHLLPAGFKGLACAALAAAIVSSLASMLNSTATIFTMDIYKPYINKSANDVKLVSVGRITAVISLIIACIMAPLLGNVEQAFQFIQEYTGILSPGILAVFLLGLFWNRTTNRAAIIGAVLSVPLALVFKLATDMPWMNQMGVTFLITVLIMLTLSHLEGKGKMDKHGLVLEKSLFNTSPTFNITSIGICIVILTLYILFW